MNNTRRRKNQNSGVSMIALVITIVVIIILAGIALITSNSTTGNAQHAKYGHELSEIEDKVKSKRIENSLKAPGELIKNEGFTKVYVENPPADFVSFDEDAITGYWVNMNTIQENEITTGHEQLTEMRVKFSVQDVYVYDASGKVYYVKGWYDGEENLHYRLDSIETGEDPEIVSAEYILAGDKKHATVKVVAKPTNGGTLTVTIGGIAISPSSENTYETIVNDNGMIMVVVKESTGGTASQTITVEGIEKEKDTTAPEITLNSKVNGKVVTIDGSIRDDESNLTGYKFTKTSEEPTDWVSVNSISVSVTYRAEESGIYYLWAKNKEGLVASKSITVTVPNVYEITYDANGGSGAPASQEKIENQSTTLSNNVPNREGYTFEGWSTSGVSTTVSYRPGDVYTGNGNLSLYAVWKVKTFTITYNANGGNGAPGSETKVYGEAKTISNIRPERTGYEFLGWSTSSSSTVASYQPGAEYTGNANLDLYAVWKAEPKKYTVTYNANGGSLGSVVASQVKTEDISMTIDRNSPVREGYTFQGWGTSTNATTASFQPGSTYAGNANLDLYAIWKANTYTVKYNANGGTLGDVPASQTKTHNKSLVLDINVPSRDGYIFDGWATTADSITANYQPGGTLVENANIELFAVWKQKTYTIKYNANGGNLDNVPSTQVKTHDVVAVLDLNKPTRTNYVFKGWDTVSTSTTASYQPGAQYDGNADLELYAIWELKTYTITYNANGGSLDKVASIQVKTHDVAMTLDNNSPVRNGYTFKGWGTTASSTTATYQPGSQYTGNADVELYAVWSINTYTIKYSANGGSLDKVPASETKTHDVAYTINANSPVRTGYTFKGWGTTSSATTASYQPGVQYTGNANLDLYAIWEIKTYTITYNANGGNLDNVPSTQSKTHGVSVNLNSNSPVRTGYIFKGWGTSSTATTASYQPGVQYTGNANLELYAIWEIKTYTIKYSANGGSLDKVPASETKTHDVTYTINANIPVRTGYTFKGWGTTSSATTASYQPGVQYTGNANLDLYAIWEIKTYTITYNANGGSLGSVPATQNKTHGVAATLNSNSPVRTGYTFKGWGTSSTATTASYQPGVQYTGNANLDLYAIWEIKTYTIKYSANGGNLDKVPASETKTHDVAYTINANSPVRTGYTFKGWGTTASSTTATYQPGSQYTGNANLDLYAIWELNQYTITYNANGGSLGSVPATQNKTHGVAATLNSNSPVRTGYTFKGWGTSASSTTASYQPGVQYTGNANLDLYAIWEIKTYTIKYSANGGNLDKVPASETKTHDVAYTINANSPVRTGYTFKGWGTTASSTTSSYQPGVQYTGNANLELYAIWEIKTYTITYNANGGSLGSVPATQNKTHGAVATLNSNSPVRTGYTFKGWGTSASSTTASYQPGVQYTGNANLELYAIWEIKTYTITYNANGGSLGSVPATQNKTHGAAATLNSNSPVRTGYTFKGWGTTSSTTTASYQPGVQYTGNANLDLYAIWEIKTYTITYNANGGSLGSVPATQNKTHGAAATLNSNSPVRTGYTFKGWGTTSNATTVAYQPGSQYIGNADIELFAIWTINTYTIAYNANGGSLGSVVASQTKKYNETITLDTNVPVRDGFVFIGWSSNSGATVGSYEAGAPYTANANVTLYAIWEEEVIYTISGTWLFNEKLILPNENMFENVSFFANDGFSTYTFEIYNSEVTFYGKYSGVLGSTDNPHIAYYEGSWVSYDSRIITFGEYPNVEEQQVSKEFYEWFIANATEYEVASVFYIEGKEYAFASGDTWASWRETNDSYDGCLDMTPIYDGPVYWGGGTQLYDTKGNVVSYYDMIIAGEHYSHNPIGYYTFTFKIDGEQYTAEDGMTWEEWLVSDYNTTGETAPTIRDSNLKIVEYNRTILASEEYSFETYELSGTWKFNDTINLPNTTLEQDIDGYYLSPMNNQMSIINIRATSSAIDYDRNLMYSSSGWENENNRVVIFNGEQEVSKEFYDWFIANATEYEEPDEETYPIIITSTNYPASAPFGDVIEETVSIPGAIKYRVVISEDTIVTYDPQVDFGDSLGIYDFNGGDIYITGIDGVEPSKYQGKEYIFDATYAELSVSWYSYNNGKFCVEIYPIFDEDEIYTITYDANGGNLGNVPSTQTKVQDVDVTLDANKPVRDGYLFKGWSTNKNATTGSYNPGDAYAANANVTLYAIWEEGKVVDVDGLGDVEVNNPDVELNYNPDSGELGGVVPPVEEEPEVPEEIPEEILPEIIEFGFGNFESKINYTPGTYETVEYENTYTRTKYPVSYYNVVWSEWSITKDAEGNITKTEPGDMQLEDIGEQYSTYIVYDFETKEALESNGVKGDSVELWTIYFDTEDSLENAVYLAAYLNKLDEKTSRHIAKWDGSKYVAYNADADIAAVNTFVETYTVTGTKQVQITAPSSSTEYVYVPVGTLKAEEGMTWAEWLESDYNTTGQTAPVIKTSDFVDVAYTDTIVAGEAYGFMLYELSGKWEFNEKLILPADTIEQEITYTVDLEYYDITITSSYVEFYRYEWSYWDEADGWISDSFRNIDFGSTPQPVSKEFYDWFTANAKQYTLSGTWVFNDELTIPEKEIMQRINYTYSDSYSEEGFFINERGVYLDVYASSRMPEYGVDFGWEMSWMKTIDFGTIPQSVSKEFYEWFTANAKQKSNNSPYDTDVIQVYSIDQWNEIADYVDAGYTFEGSTIQLVGDLDFEFSESVKTIGANSIFSGTFNGDNYTLSGVANPLFGHVKDATIKDITINQANINKTGTSNIGALICYAEGNASVVNVQIHESSISGQNNVGSLIGYANGDVSINDVSNYNSSISGEENVGILVGKAENTINMLNIVADGSVVEGNTNVGGFIGNVTNENLVTIENGYVTYCYLTAKNNVAEFVGNVGNNSTNTVKFIECYAFDCNCEITQMITFSIYGNDYQAEEGMTWAEWVNSSYNVNGFVIADGSIYTSDKKQKLSGKTSSDKIQSGSSVSLVNVSSGGPTTHGGGSN